MTEQKNKNNTKNANDNTNNAVGNSTSNFTSNSTLNVQNNFQIFENEEFGKVRTIIKDGEPWFVGKDIAVVLGYSNPQKAIRDHVDVDDKTVNETFTVNGTAIIQINESGLYSLILSSKLPTAKKFKRWVTKEILPTIRKTGGYVSDDEMFVNSYLPFADEPTKQLFKMQLQQIRTLNNTVYTLNEKIEQDKPLVAFAKQVHDTTDLIDMEEMSKLLYKKGINIGRNKLFKFLKLEKILMKDNIPYQWAINSGYFAVKEKVYENSYYKKNYIQVFVTPKGQEYIYRKLNSEKSKDSLMKLGIVR